MIEEEIIGGGVKNPPRHSGDARYAATRICAATVSAKFVLRHVAADRRQANHQRAVCRGLHDRTARSQPTDRVLEIGTGSGYQAAVLSPLVKDVYTIEIVESLGRHAEETLKRLKYNNVHVKIGDGYQGWAEHAPFDKIIVTCSPEKVPQPLIDQLREGGQMVIPVGERFEQMLYRYTKKDGKLVAEPLRPTLFVPMTGTAEAGRVLQPDPLRPQIVHGGFEEPVGDDGEPRGWYYCRQMKVVEALDAPEGKRYIQFTNDVPGRMSRALQGFAVDGKKIGFIEVTASIRGHDIKPGPSPDELPQISLTYYDDNWAIISRNFIGPFRGTFDWQQITQRLPVPPKASKCIMHIGLLGAVGEFSVDDVSIRAIAR